MGLQQDLTLNELLFPAQLDEPFPTQDSDRGSETQIFQNDASLTLVDLMPRRIQVLDEHDGVVLANVVRRLADTVDES